jgi:hypothetical protein
VVTVAVDDAPGLDSIVRLAAKAPEHPLCPAPAVAVAVVVDDLGVGLAQPGLRGEVLELAGLLEAGEQARAEVLLELGSVSVAREHGGQVPPLLQPRRELRAKAVGPAEARPDIIEDDGGSSRGPAKGAVDVLEAQQPGAGDPRGALASSSAPAGPDRGGVGLAVVAGPVEREQAFGVPPLEGLEGGGAELVPVQRVAGDLDGHPQLLEVAVLVDVVLSRDDPFAHEVGEGAGEVAGGHGLASQRSFAWVGCLSTRGRDLQDHDRPRTSPTTTQPAARSDVPGSEASV